MDNFKGNQNLETKCLPSTSTDEKKNDGNQNATASKTYENEIESDLRIMSDYFNANDESDEVIESRDFRISRKNMIISAFKLLYLKFFTILQNIHPEGRDVSYEKLYKRIIKIESVLFSKAKSLDNYNLKGKLLMRILQSQAFILNFLKDINVENLFSMKIYSETKDRYGRAADYWKRNMYLKQFLCTDKYQKNGGFCAVCLNYIDNLKFNGHFKDKVSNYKTGFTCNGIPKKNLNPFCVDGIKFGCPECLEQRCTLEYMLKHYSQCMEKVGVQVEALKLFGRIERLNIAADVNAVEPEESDTEVKVEANSNQVPPSGELPGTSTSTGCLKKSTTKNIKFGQSSSSNIASSSSIEPVIHDYNLRSKSSKKGKKNLK